MIKPLSYVEKIQPYIPGKPIKEVERELGIKECIKLASMKPGRSLSRSY